MFKKQEEQFQVFVAGSIIYRDGHYYKVHDYGVVEIAPPEPLKKDATDENS